MIRFLISLKFWGVGLIRVRRLLKCGTDSDLSVNGAGRRLFEAVRLLEEIRYVNILY